MQETIHTVRRWSVWLCLTLMFWTAAAEFTHNHPNQTERTCCSICAVALSASPAACSNYAVPMFAAIGILREEEIIANPRLDVSDLGIRGPPSA